MIDIGHSRFWDVEEEPGESTMEMRDRPERVGEELEELLDLFRDERDFPGHRCYQYAKEATS